MKRILICVLSAGMLTGCAKSEQAVRGASKTDMIESIAASNEASSAGEAASDETEKAAVLSPEATLAQGEASSEGDEIRDAAKKTLPDTEVDLDLMDMSASMIYASVMNLMQHPDNYLGKTIRMAGKFRSMIMEDSGAEYFACEIPDAAACCQQGIEFVRKGSYSFPEDYPRDGEYIIVEGVLEMYEEDGYRYIHLVDSDMRLLSSLLEDG